MKVLFQEVRIIDSESRYHDRSLDLLIEEGRIAAIGEGLKAEGAQVYKVPGLCVSAGWVDARAALREPGLEQEEDFASLEEAAARGGFTEVVLMPNSQPAVDSKDTLSYVREKGRRGSVLFHPTATVTRKAEGVDFSEMLDLHHGGAVAFTDGENAIQSSDILLKALLYLLPVDALLMNRPDDHQLSVFGQMHEGVTSTLLGLKGIPALAEEMMVARDLKLLKYAIEHAATRQFNRPLLHFSMISTAGAVALIREAKAEKLPVSCDIAAHQLVFDDTALMNFDTNLKVNPPFRSAADIAALREGLADGTIDLLVSDHTPHAPESKDREFDLASFGIISLETAFSHGRMYSGLPLGELVRRFTTVPRHILRLPAAPIASGSPANLTFFEPDAEWEFEQTASKSRNTPFFRTRLKGKVRGIVNGAKFKWF